MFKAGMKLDALYNLLVKEGEFPEKDVEVLESGKNKDKFTVDIEDSRTTIEVSHSFTSSDNYFLSYLLRTIMYVIEFGCIYCILVSILVFFILSSISNCIRYLDLVNS